MASFNHPRTKRTDNSKYYTLDDAWAICLDMWDYIATQVSTDNNMKDIHSLKNTWLMEHGYADVDFAADCAFCQYKNMRFDEELEILVDKNPSVDDNELIKRLEHEYDDCEWCPGFMIDRSFDCCDVDTHYSTKPVEFFNVIKFLYERYRRGECISKEGVVIK